MSEETEAHDAKLVAMIAAALKAEKEKDEDTNSIEKSTIKTTVVVGFVITVLIGYLGWCGATIYGNSTAIASMNQSLVGVQQEKFANIATRINKVEASIEALHNLGRNDLKEIRNSITELRIAIERNKLQQLESSVNLAETILAAAKARHNSTTGWPIRPVPESSPAIKDVETKAKEAIDKNRRDLYEQRKLVEKFPGGK